MLTERQKECLDFIVRYLRENGGVSPSLVDIGNALDLTSKSTVHHIVGQLELRGFIRREPYRQRGIEVLQTAPSPRIPIYRASDNKLMGWLP